jgi:peptidoglycan/xylan/chitin deacetylase (PgdA/CDA1 family)
VTQPRPVRPLLLAGAGAAATAAAYWGVGAATAPPLRRLLRRAVLSRLPLAAPLVALTFDDGPDPAFTERFLAALGDTPATFFPLGERVRRWPRLARLLAEAGHEVACHGDSHRSLAALPPRATVASLRRARGSIADACGAAPRFFRPPYGTFNLAAWRAAPRLGMRRTLWSTWARDWEARITPQQIAARLLRGATPGAILLLHDADGSPGAPTRTLAALPAILDGLRQRGLRPVTLSALTDASAAPAPMLEVRR